MRITNDNPFVKLQAYVKNIRNEKKINTETRHTSEEIFKEDTVVLSPKAKEIQEARKLIASIPDIREDKVASIKKQIDEHTYQVNSDKIADSILRESLIDDILDRELR